MDQLFSNYLEAILEAILQLFSSYLAGIQQLFSSYWAAI